MMSRSIEQRRTLVPADDETQVPRTIVAMQPRIDTQPGKVPSVEPGLALDSIHGQAGGAPPGLLLFHAPFPGLPSWALLWRAYGAEFG